ncbi:MAG: HD domain-containing protein [Chloroflexi bacterium]|uniref:HD domain-containing protein n=1 Tax=Candidatus Chlorohelix allophototropha TaxID=3003348 RepID=A0A8T7M815_9CHLR|nr:HD domain-containing protein [Chloroflexota bacterium]
MLTSRFEDALVFATKLHSRQTRKGSETPYVAHLLAVASIVLEHGATEDQAIAALLHDAVEDQGGLETLELIRQKYGEAVAQIVLGCSDSFEIPKPPWRERKEKYLEHITQASSSILLVSAADKLHNARSTLNDFRTYQHDVWQRFRGGMDGILWYFRALVEQFRGRVPESLLRELDLVVSNLEKEALEGRN